LLTVFSILVVAAMCKIEPKWSPAICTIQSDSFGFVEGEYLVTDVLAQTLLSQLAKNVTALVGFSIIEIYFLG
jgi:hypothetical protein